MPRGPPPKNHNPHLTATHGPSIPSAPRATLPPEVLYHIFALSLLPYPHSHPILSPSNPLKIPFSMPDKRQNQLRLDTLRSLSLVSRSVNAWAADQLLHHTVLYGSKKINLFLKICQKYPLAVARKVEHLTLDGWEAFATNTQQENLLLTSNSNSSSNQSPVPSVHVMRRGTVTSRLPQLMALCQNIKTLQVRGAVIFSLTDFDGSHRKFPNFIGSQP
jgi:hypothetical protein